MGSEYHALARAQEKSNNHGAALLLYISSFCEAVNEAGCDDLPPVGTVAKIRQMQDSVGLSDASVCALARSYGHLDDEECQRLLFYSFCGNTNGIRSILGGRHV